jgi:hypothetical protein
VSQCNYCYFDMWAWESKCKECNTPCCSRCLSHDSLCPECSDDAVRPAQNPCPACGHELRKTPAQYVCDACGFDHNWSDGPKLHLKDDRAD